MARQSIARLHTTSCQCAFLELFKTRLRMTANYQHQTLRNDRKQGPLDLLLVFTVSRELLLGAEMSHAPGSAQQCGVS